MVTSIFSILVSPASLRSRKSFPSENLFLSRGLVRTASSARPARGFLRILSPSDPLAFRCGAVLACREIYQTDGKSQHLSACLFEKFFVKTLEALISKEFRAKTFFDKIKWRGFKRPKTAVEAQFRHPEFVNSACHSLASPSHFPNWTRKFPEKSVKKLFSPIPTHKKVGPDTLQTDRTSSTTRGISH